MPHYPRIRASSQEDETATEEKLPVIEFRHRRKLSVKNLLKLSNPKKKVSYDNSNSWVFVAQKNRPKLDNLEVYARPVMRAGPLTPRRNRRSVKSCTHTFSQRQIVNVCQHMKQQ